MTLVDFLLERIAEDEHKARSVRRMTPFTPSMPHVWHGDGKHFIGDPFDWFMSREISEAEYRELIEKCSEPAEPDPRILAECESKRRIVELLHMAYDCTAAGQPGHKKCGNREWCYTCGDSVSWPCDTLKALALPFADHPDFDEAWRVT